MKRIVVLSALVLVISAASGCARKSVSLSPNVSKDIAVLTLNGMVQTQTQDQAVELDRIIKWMDRDILKNMKRAGYHPLIIKDIKGYNEHSSKLLIIDVENFNAGNRAARAFAGFGAGSSSLDLHYKLLDEKGADLLSWKDGVGSSKGGTYCAQKLNRAMITKLTAFFNSEVSPLSTKSVRK